MTYLFLTKNQYLRCLGILAAMVFIFLEARQSNDFEIFLAAAADIVHHLDAYHILYKGCYHYYNSPLFAIALFPLTFFPVYVAKLIWLSFNLVFLYRTWRALVYFMDLTFFSERQKALFTVLCFVFVLYFLKENFHCGQMTIFMLFLSVEGICRIMTGRSLSGALLISIAINIKLLPLIILPYLFYRGYFKALALSCTFLVVLAILPACFIGYDFNLVLLKSWFDLLNPSHPEHLIDTAERSFHGLSSWLPTLLMDHVTESEGMTLKRNIANLDTATVVKILNYTRGALILFTVYFLRTWLFIPASGKLKAFWELAYLFLLVPLIFPHQQHYAFYFMLPAGTYLCYYLFVQSLQAHKTISRLKYRLIFTGMILVLLINNLELLLGEFGGYYVHFKIITYGALLMIPMLAWAKPGVVPE
jgi:hypothetical protein